MASTAATPAATAMARGNSMHSSLGTVPPINTPTRRFYGSRDKIDTPPRGIPNPNIYVVQPFKNASVPKDFVYAKKNAPNPGEKLLNSTIELIDHFTSCYEAVKHQLQDEHTKERETLLQSRMMARTRTSQTCSTTTCGQRMKQAKFRPLILNESQLACKTSREPTIQDCVGILPIPTSKADDLVEVYDEKLRLLRRLKPEFFDSQGNIISQNLPRPNTFSQTSLLSSKKGITPTFRTPFNTVLMNENMPGDERRTFLTQLTHEEDDNENDQDERKSVYFNSTPQRNSLNDIMNNSYVLKVLEIKTMPPSSSTKRDRTKSASDKGSYFSHKGSATVKST